ncbi:MAG: WYL domain-containing protein [Gallionella sp.]|nr:WYL domain-containing protein [Gallionella sp.]
MANSPKLRDQRLRIMEGVLDWEGEIGNARVRKLFDLQPVQASRLLAEFRAQLGDQLIEDGRAKVLRLANPEQPCSKMLLDEYVRQTQIVDDPNTCIVDARVDLTDVRAPIFATLRKSALDQTGVLISYASMTNPAFSERIVFPHSIVHVGRRWHIRAWCAKRNEFRDFTLGRIKSAEPLTESTPHPIADDEAWNRIVQLRLIAHRHLSAEQQLVVRNEYFQGTMARRLSVRACLAQYIIQDLRAAINPGREVPPDYQMEVSNAADIKLWPSSN